MLQNKKEWLEAQYIRIVKDDNADYGFKVYQKNRKTKEEKELKIYLNIRTKKYGKAMCYLVVPHWNYQKGNTGITTLHKMVYLQFKGDIPKGYEIDHIDSDTFNNEPENLQAITRDENQKKRGPYTKRNKINYEGV